MTAATPDSILPGSDVENVIAIDGPAGAGKSTVARAVAARTGLPYLDTGAMYRCIALAVLREGLDPADESRVAVIAEASRIELDGRVALLDGEDVSDRIRGPEVSSVVSVIATHPRVRTAMRSQQQRWVEARGGAVVEGRDIATVVFPRAALKVFLTASARERARRRVEQVGGDIEEIAAAIAERDHMDSTRADSPLRPADGAIHIDSSGCDVEEVVARICRAWKDSEGG